MQLECGDHEDDKRWKYVTMTSHERLTLDPKMGAVPWRGEECRDGIIRIERLAHPGLGPAGSDDPAWWVEADRNELLLPHNVRYGKNRKYLPLGAVWQLNGQYRHTGRMFFEELAEGRLAIRRPFREVPAVGGDPVTHWDCLLVDSHDYTDPSEVETVETSYQACAAPEFQATRVVDLAPGYHSACAATLDEQAWCWGDNSAGQLGDLGPATHEAVWVGGLDSGIRQITAGVVNTCAVDLGLRAWCWGANTHGQLGAGLPPGPQIQFFPERVAFP
jgi:hypothetical protein